MNREQLHATATFILNCEARRDKQGHLRVYDLPEGDGGGSFEVAGINDRFDHDIAYSLLTLLRKGQHQAAEEMAVAYYIQNTDGVATWCPQCAAVEAFLRDAAFNRGVGGAAKILQLALGVAADGKVGAKTLAALSEALSAPKDLIQEMHHACETYERRVAPPVGARAKFWNGLVNRWAKRRDFALTLLT